MYPGHMLAWICSGIMVAAVGREMNPGLMAYESLGLAGVAGLVLAGWTTANPTLYRAGLALQAITPNWPRWKITLAAGTVTTIISCFPLVFMKLLDYVAIYGLVLMPIGAIVFAEHWILPKLKIEPNRAEKNQALDQLDRSPRLGGDAHHLLPPSHPPLFPLAPGLCHRPPLIRPSPSHPAQRDQGGLKWNAKFWDPGRPQYRPLPCLSGPDLPRKNARRGLQVRIFLRFGSLVHFRRSSRVPAPPVGQDVRR